MSRVGLIDVDGHNFPSLPLMKLSAWHKAKGDSVEWYSPLLSGMMDVVYMAKVFSFTPDYQWGITSDRIIRGGTGYCIQNHNGKESYNKENDRLLAPEIEHYYPDYGLYGISSKAYGFLSRGCPRGCDFCHVKDKEGRRSYKVADLSEFWRGQKEIEICDPNILACPDYENLLRQLADSKAVVEINQGLDARLLNTDNIRLLSKIRMRSVHFAWDRMKDEEKIVRNLELFCQKTNIRRKDIAVYVLTNFDTEFDQDLYRIGQLRRIGVSPYVMIYDKEHADKKYRKMQRWTNSRQLFWSVESFEDVKG